MRRLTTIHWFGIGLLVTVLLAATFPTTNTRTVTLDTNWVLSTTVSNAFRSNVVQGANMTITYDSRGRMTLAASAGGGGGIATLDGAGTNTTFWASASNTVPLTLNTPNGYNPQTNVFEVYTGSVMRVFVDSNGVFNVGSAIKFTNGVNLNQSGANVLEIIPSGTADMRFYATGGDFVQQYDSSGSIRWSSTSASSGAADTILMKRGASHLVLVNAGAVQFCSVTVSNLHASSIVTATNYFRVGNTNASDPSETKPIIYSKNVSGTEELFVRDSGGTATQITDDAWDGPPWLYDADDPWPRVQKKYNSYLGLIQWFNVGRMELFTTNTPAQLALMPAQKKVLRHIETFEQYNARAGSNLMVKRDWQADQDAVQADYDATRTSLQAEMDAGNTNIVVPPTIDVRRPMPTWLRDREGTR